MQAGILLKMKLMQRIPAFLVLLSSFILASCGNKFATPPPGQSIEALDVAFEECAATLAGKAYVKTVSELFLKKARLDKCLLPGDPIHAPATIYFTVDALGSVNSTIIKPESLLSVCLKENIGNLSVPTPPSNKCVVRILLKFEGETEENEQ
jgi:hypothetical protein